MKPDIKMGIPTTAGFYDLVKKTGFETSQVTQNWLHGHNMTCDNGTIPSHNIRCGQKKFVNQNDKFGNTSIGNRNGTGK